MPHLTTGTSRGVNGTPGQKQQLFGAQSGIWLPATCLIMFAGGQQATVQGRSARWVEVALKAAAAQVLALGTKLDEENTMKINYELLVLKCFLTNLSLMLPTSP